MKTQHDTKVRMVALENLRAMCKRASGMCHRFWVESVSRSRVKVGYSNPNEYGAEHPVFAVFPAIPSEWADDKENPRVLLGCMLRTIGGDDETWQMFDAIVDGDVLWRSPTDGTWKTEAEIKNAKGVAS